MITSNTALGMFTNLYLVLLLVIADSLVPKFHLQFRKSKREVRELVGHRYKLADGVTASVQLRVVVL